MLWLFDKKTALGELACSRKNCRNDFSASPAISSARSPHMPGIFWGRGLEGLHNSLAVALVVFAHPVDEVEKVAHSTLLRVSIERAWRLRHLDRLDFEVAFFDGVQNHIF